RGGERGGASASRAGVWVLGAGGGSPASVFLPKRPPRPPPLSIQRAGARSMPRRGAAPHDPSPPYHEIAAEARMSVPPWNWWPPVVPPWDWPPGSCGGPRRRTGQDRG